jgi:hypothetical protein
MTARYEKDFYSWTQEQAALLRNGQFVQVDLEHIIEEIESMGRSERREIRNRLSVLLAHLLKWKFQPELQSRSWSSTIYEQRRQLISVLDDNPSLAAQLDEAISIAYPSAVLQAADETGIDETHFPTTCPWSSTEIVRDKFLPT